MRYLLRQIGVVRTDCIQKPNLAPTSAHEFSNSLPVIPAVGALLTPHSNASLLLVHHSQLQLIYRRRVINLDFEAKQFPMVQHEVAERLGECLPSTKWRSLTVAAERRLYTPPPSPSRQIKDLECEVGEALLTRSAGGSESYAHFGYS